MQSDRTRLLELALYEIRGLLADYLGSDVHAPMSVRVAVHVGYAVHNEAEAAFNNVDFRLILRALKSAVIDQVLGGTDGAALLRRFLPVAKDRFRPEAVTCQHLELPQLTGHRSIPCHRGALNPIAAWPRPTFEEMRFAGSEK